MKTALELQQAAQEKKLTRLHIRDCSLCGYPLAYLFSPSYQHVGLDTGCDCVTYGPVIHESSWEEVAQHYNLHLENLPESDYTKNMQEYFGFAEGVKS